MRVSTVLFSLSAAFCLLGLLAHELIAPALVLQPLIDSDLPPNVVSMHLFSWHVGAVAIVIMAGLFIAAIRARNGRTLALFATAMSAGFAILGISMALFGNADLWTTPAPYLWTLIAVLGGGGVLAYRDKQG